MAREDLHFRLRIPEALKDKIAKAAEENRRSMTAEIIGRLELTFDAEESPISEDDLVEKQQRDNRRLTDAVRQQNRVVQALLVALAEKSGDPNLAQEIRSILPRAEPARARKPKRPADGPD